MIDDAERAGTGEALGRLVYTAGIGAALAFVVGGAWLQLAGIESIDADGSAILKAVSEHRTSLLACYVFWNLAIMGQLVFLGALGLAFFQRGHSLAALIGVLAGTVLTALMFVGFAFLGSLAFRAPYLSPETSVVLSDLFYLVLSLAGFPSALATVALSSPLLRAQGFARLVGCLGIAAAVVHIEAAAALARSGTWSPAGWGGYLAPALFVGWMLGVSIVFLRSSSAVEDAA